jgi:hypothetical protein
MLESDADRESMLQSLGGVSIAGPRGTFTGLLELDYIGVGEIPVDDFSPRLAARTSELARCGVTNNVALIVDGATYVVRSVQPDGTGMTVLMLEGP